jgi:SWI/SNF-related matrix-associated actin-dependent regulator of chromatin subfamily A member 5
MAEFERFCPSMRCIRFHGPKVERTRIKTDELSDVREFDVVLTTYEMLTSECNWFRRKFLWRVLIVDEGHRLKNEKSQLSDRLRKVWSIAATRAHPKTWSCIQKLCLTSGEGE